MRELFTKEFKGYHLHVSPTGEFAITKDYKVQFKSPSASVLLNCRVNSDGPLSGFFDPSRDFNYSECPLEDSMGCLKVTLSDQDYLDLVIPRMSALWLAAAKATVVRDDQGNPRGNLHQLLTFVKSKGIELEIVDATKDGIN